MLTVHCVFRYFYYTQLRHDVLSGKLIVDSESAIALAGYALQAESGDFDAIQHSLSHLGRMQLLPQSMCLHQGRVLKDLLQQIQAAHRYKA